MFTWPGLDTIVAYARRDENTMLCRGFYMGEKVATHGYVVGKEECKRFLSPEMWDASSASGTQNGRRTGNRFDVMWDGKSAIEFEGETFGCRRHAEREQRVPKPKGMPRAIRHPRGKAENLSQQGRKRLPKAASSRQRPHASRLEHLAARAPERELIEHSARSRQRTPS